MDEQVMRVPPNNADAEKSVLGCMMQDREALSMAFELLGADDFYQPANREVFDAMHQLNTQGMPIDLVTVDDELSRRGTLEGVGGTNYLVELSQCMPSTVNAKAYAQIVDEKATLRRRNRNLFHFWLCRRSRDAARNLMANTSFKRVKLIPP